MTDTASTTSSTPSVPPWTRWLYPILAITGIAVGIFVIVAGLYLVFGHPSGCHPSMRADMPTTQSKDCCASMMKDMKMPSMPPMPSMPMPIPSR